MLGIDLNIPIIYKYASLRFFKEGECHVSRFCKDDVLLLVYDGILRFCEDGVQFELHPGQYHIQKQNSEQSGELVSDAPKYLYVHFLANWSENEAVLPRSGNFEYAKLKPLIDELDALAHNSAPYITKAGKLYELLSLLFYRKPMESTADSIANFIAKEYLQSINLDILCREFHYSKNHIINTFKKSFGMSPITYANHLRLQQAEHLIEVTSDPLEKIATQCGFQNYSHFYKLFVRKNAISPNKWREQKRIG